MTETKNCRRCATEQPTANFARDRRTSTGLNSVCRQCYSADRQKWRDTQIAMHGLDAVQAKSTGRRRKAYSARTARFIAEHGLTAYRAEQARRKRKSLLRKLGLTQERLDAIKEKQGGRCAICLNIPEPTPRQLIAPVPGLVIDHDHDTGRFRGLICIKCNAGIGMFLDDPERLRRAIGYLEAAKQ